MAGHAGRANFEKIVFKLYGHSVIFHYGLKQQQNFAERVPNFYKYLETLLDWVPSLLSSSFRGHPGQHVYTCAPRKIGYDVYACICMCGLLA